MAKRQVGARKLLAMIRCRAYGHQWLDRGWLAMIRRGVACWSQRFDCQRCNAARDDFRTRATRRLIHRDYTLPDGYPGRMPKADALDVIILGDTESARVALAQQSPFVHVA